MNYVVMNAAGQFLAVGREAVEYPDAIKYRRKADAIAGAKRFAEKMRKPTQVIAEHGFNSQQVVFKYEVPE